MRRLSLTIFLSLLASLLLMALAVSWIWHWRVTDRVQEQESRFTEALAAQVIPAAGEGQARLQEALQYWHRRLKVDVQVIDAQGRVLAAAGRRFKRNERARIEGSPVEGTGGADQPLDNGPGNGPGKGARGPGAEKHRRGQPMMAVIHEVALPDERVLLIRSWRPEPPRPPIDAPLALLILFVAVGLAAWPVSRRITRRLESLQHTVDQQAAGNLQIRAAVEGRDEVAALAQSFNHAAAQFEALVNRQDALLQSQRRLLANASHELRSPLARIRMAVELMLDSPDDLKLHTDEVRQNIRELDELVEEILLASRLDTQSPGQVQKSPLDIVALAAEEAARVEAELQVEGPVPDEILGDLRLLRRLLRNLLENARRYHPAGEEAILLRLKVDPAEAPGLLCIEVLDRGPGVPAAARERIFEAFYRVDGHSEKAGNVGLGLALVRQIARSHDGEAVHEDRPGGGSCFVVTLPIQAA